MSSTEVAEITEIICINPAACQGNDLLQRLIHKCDGDPKILILSLGNRPGGALPPRMVEKWANENRFTYEFYSSNPFDQDLAVTDHQMATECAGRCGYAVTWHHSYCCRVCERAPGEHGPRCDRQALPVQAKEEEITENETSIAKHVFDCDDDNAGYFCNVEATSPMDTIARFIDQYKDELHKVVIFQQGHGNRNGCWKGGVMPEQVKHLAAGGNLTVVTGSCYGGQWLKHFDGITAASADDIAPGDGKGGQFWYWLFNGDDFPCTGAPHCRGFLSRACCLTHHDVAKWRGCFVCF